MQIPENYGELYILTIKCMYRDDDMLYAAHPKTAKASGRTRPQRQTESRQGIITEIKTDALCVPEPIRQMCQLLSCFCSN